MKIEKLIGIVIIILSIAVICLATMQLIGLWKNAIIVFEPLLGVILLLQSIQFWNKNRKVAVFLLCISILLLGLALYFLFFYYVFCVL